MKIRVCSIILILFVSINIIFAQNIPDTAKTVMSFNLGSMTAKMNTTPKKIMKDILREESSSFSVNDYFAFEKIMDSIDFYSYIYIISYNGVFEENYDNNYFILIPCEDINSLKSGLYDLMGEYEINTYKSGGIEYINFVEENVICAYKNGIFCISVGSDNYIAIDGIEEIFYGDPLMDRFFLELNNKNYDIKVWNDLSSLNDYAKEVIDYRYIRDSSFSFYLNFTEKDAVCNFSVYLPNISLSPMKKRLDDKMIKYIDDSLFFSTLSLDGEGIIDVLNTYFPIIKKVMEDELSNDNIDLFNVFGGDVVFSLLGDEDYLLAFSLENQNKFIRLLRDSSSSSFYIRQIGNDSYLIEDYDYKIYIKDSVACLFNSEVDYEHIENVIYNQNRKIAGNNLKFLMNNDMTFYINVANIRNLLIDSEYGLGHDDETRILIRELKYISGSANIENNKITSNFRIDFRNGTEEFLRSMLSLLDF